jgi:hypothetical protein
MYSTSNRETTPREKNALTPGAEMDDMAILEKAIELVKKNVPEHRGLIGQLAATAQSLSGLQPILGLEEPSMAYADRPEAIAKTVLDDMRFNR